MTRHPHRGFTLIELLVAMAIGSIVLLTAASMLGRGGTEYERVGGNVGSAREARAVITQLIEDLRTARFHPDMVFEKSTADWPLDRLGLLTLQPADAQSTAGRIGDLCAVHYYLKDLTINGKTVRCLMRGFRESSDTFDAIARDNTASLFSPAERDEPIAFGVLAFEARPKTRGEDPGTWTAWKPGATPTATTAPEAVELRMVIARRQLAAKLTSPSAWDGGGTTSPLLGTYDNATNNRQVEVVTTLTRFGGGQANKKGSDLAW
jgi:prepilin-type N-terminal cleavage/methylation domain-containing protein